MRRLSKAAQWLTGSFIVLVMAVGTLLMFLGSGCGNDVSSETISPDRKWKAVIFAVDCGATTTSKELVPRVSIIRADETLSDPNRGNVFGVGNRKATPPVVQVDWTGPHELTIQYPSKASVFKQETKYKDVTIKYVAEP
ncbi:MAG TPA: hypothetical protein VGP65_17475 [Candidatus Angelobacter sp.]|nr:hypothetical protein [Candidatus Angelobacter sp.]